MLTLALIWAAFAISVTQLSAFPILHSDEAWTLQPGYSFWTRGHFVAPMFTRYNGMDQLYLEFLPLYSLLEGGFVMGVHRTLSSPLLQCRGGWLWYRDGLCSRTPYCQPTRRIHCRAFARHLAMDP